MRVGTICYATTQGLGVLAKSFYDAGIITDVIVFRHPHRDRPSHMEWYPEGTPELRSRPFGGPAVDEFLTRVDVVLFFETPFDWSFLLLCRDRDVPTILIPMHEWYPENPPHQFDKIISPSLLDQDYFPGSSFIPIPVDPSRWKQRTKAVRFLHNGGHLGCREHKGTRQLLEAVPRLDSTLQLTIRSQNARGLRSIVQEALNSREFPNLRIELGEIPYKDLWEGYDVLVAPEKFNGISLPLIEARTEGMLVITTDRYPMSTWLPNERKGPLIPVSSERKARTTGGHLEFTESIVDPQDIAQMMNDWHNRDISDYSLSGRQWAEENSWDALKPRYVEELELAVCQY